MKKMYLLIFLLIPMFGISQTTNISGVVTYFFNDYQGNKPDIGAKVYIIDSINNSVFNFSVVDTFYHARLIRGLYMAYLELFSNYDREGKKYEGKKKYPGNWESFKEQWDKSKNDVDQSYADLVKYGVETDEKFSALDKRTFAILMKVNEENSILRTVDGNGNYSVNVRPGTYYIYMVSKNRTFNNLCEIMGKIYCKRVLIKENQTKDVSHNFDQH